MATANLPDLQQNENAALNEENAPSSNPINSEANPPRDEGQNHQNNAGAGNRANNNAFVNNNNNNIVRNNLGSLRERLFQALFFRITLVYARNFPPPIRRFLEFMILFKALMMLSLLVYIHFAFIKSPITCLDNIVNDWATDGILRIEIIKNSDEKYTLNDSYQKESNLHRKHIAIMEAYNSYVSLILEDTEPSLVLNDEVIEDQDNKDSNVSLEIPPDSDTIIESFEFSWAEEDYIFEYSLEHGFLRLSLNARSRLNISVKLVVLDPNNDTCFGGPLSRFVLDEFIGYDDLLLNSLKYLAEKENQKSGYVRNVVTGEHYRFVNSLPYSGSLFYAMFVMVAFTFCVSTLLRYSHHHIFLFIIHLLQMMEMNNNITFPAAPLLTVVLALVGMEAFMSDFFRDNSLAFYVIVLIWLSDQYDAICCHTRITKKYWLRFFYLYQFAFFAHHQKFNGQYSGIALMTSWLFICHSMLYFYHHYELPVLEQAQVVRHIRTIVLRNIQNDEAARGENNVENQPQPNANPAPNPNSTNSDNTNNAGNPNNVQEGGPNVINLVLRVGEVGNNNGARRRQIPFATSLRNLWNSIQNVRDGGRNGIRQQTVDNENANNPQNNGQNQNAN